MKYRLSYNDNGNQVVREFDTETFKRDLNNYLIGKAYRLKREGKTDICVTEINDEVKEEKQIDVKKTFGAYLTKLRRKHPDLCEIYVSLYNEEGNRFFGGFNSDKSLDEYSNYEVKSVVKLEDVVERVTLIGYHYGLGLDSIRAKQRKEEE